MITSALGKSLINFNVLRHTLRLVRESRLDASSIERIQFRRLRRLLYFAYTHFDFYRDRFDAAGFHPDSFRTLRDIQRVPTLNKAEYRSFTQSQMARDPQRYRDYYQVWTSGSTGTPLEVVRTWNERAYMIAKWMRALFLNGLGVRDRTFSVLRPQRMHRDSVIQNLGIMPRISIAYTAQPAEMVHAYIASKADVLYANKSQLVQMSAYIKKHGIEVPRPRMYVSAAETLDQNSKRLITSVFGTDNLIEVYGAVEFNNMAWTRPGSHVFQFSHTTNLLELFDGADMDTDEGACLITDFHIFSFPMIRYELGDVLQTEVRNGIRQILAIRGRHDDWVISPDGYQIPFHVFYEIMEHYPQLTQFRFIQRTRERVCLQLVGSEVENRPVFESSLTNDLNRDVPGKFEFEFEWMSELPPDPNGKLRMIVSELGGGQS